MKKWVKYNRRFLNMPKSQCLGALSWSVECYQQKIYDHKTDDYTGKKKWVVNGNVEINRDAQTHYVHRKADMRPLYAMQKELNTFVAACEKALQDAEEANAKS